MKKILVFCLIFLSLFNLGADNLTADFANAIRRRNLEEVKSLTEKGADLNATYYGSTLLYLAVDGKAWDIASYLIEQGADVTANSTLVGMAVYNKKYDLAKKLIEKGADINGLYYSSTPLYYAIDDKAWDMAEYLIEHGADLTIETSHVSKAVYNKNYDLAKKLIEAGADIDGMYYSSTAIYYAIDKKAWDMAEYLIEHGADLTIETSHVSKAVYNKNYDLAKKLIEAGADIDGMYYSSTAIYYAIDKKAWDMAEYLIDHEADVTIETSHVSKAVYSKNYDLAKKLIDAGADIDGIYYGSTALYHAIDDKAWNMAEYLIDHEADVTIETSHVSKAVYSKNYDLAKKLIEAGADIDGIYYGSTALYHAIDDKAWDMAEYLIDHEADVTIETSHVSKAVYSKNYDLAKKLIEAGADIDGTYYGSTALYHAIDNKANDIALIIISNDAKLTGFAYVAMALYNGMPDVASALVAKGADTTEMIYYGYNAVKMASRLGYDWDTIVSAGDVWLNSLVE